MQDKRAFLVVGYGGTGKRFERNLRRVFGDCCIDILNTSKMKKNETKCENVGNIYYDIQQVLFYKYDAIFVAVPTSVHIEYVNQIIDCSDIFIIEKPLDSALAKCELFARNMAKKQKKVFVNFQKRFLSSWYKTKQLLEDKNIFGELQYGTVCVNSDMTTWRQKDYLTLYASRRELGGGAVLTECHEIDFLQWVLGKISGVYSVCVNSDKQMDVETSVHYIASINEHPITFNIDMISKEVRNNIELFFENGTIKLDTINDQLSYYIYNEKQWHTLTKEGDDANILAIQAIKGLIENNTQDERLVELEESVSVNAVVEAVQQSNKTGKYVDVVPSIFPKEGVDIIGQVVKKSIDQFGNDVIAIYGMGSLGYGGYVDGWSDFDIDIIIDTTYQNAKECFLMGKQIEKEIQESGFSRIDIRTYNHIHLNERKTVLSFGQCSRAVMLKDTAKLIYGIDIRDEIARPNIKEMNMEALGLCLSFLEKDDYYWNDLPWDDIAAFYALIARFLYSSDTGEVAGKKIAIKYFVENYLSIFPVECRPWFIWAYALRLSYEKVLLQEVIKKECVESLKRAFVVVHGLIKDNIDKDNSYEDSNLK